MTHQHSGTYCARNVTVFGVYFMQVCQRVAELYPKNYYAWTQRSWVVLRVVGGAFEGAGASADADADADAGAGAEGEVVGAGSSTSTTTLAEELVKCRKMPRAGLVQHCSSAKSLPPNQHFSAEGAKEENESIEPTGRVVLQIRGTPHALPTVLG